MLAAMEERKRRKRATPLLYFTPHPKQRAFFDALAAKRVVLFSGGNRSGKTVCSAVALIEHAYGYRITQAAADGVLAPTEDGDYPPRSAVPPRYWIRRADGVPLRDRPQVLGVTGLALLKGIGNILWPELQNWLPEQLLGRLKVTRGAFGVPVKVVHPDELWTLHFGSIEQGSMAFEGAKSDAVCFDEPPTRTVFTAVWRGCVDYFAPVWFTFTPLGSNAPWLYEEFYTGERDDAAIIEVSQSDNPYLSAEALSAFEQGVQFTEEELLARKSGKFGFLTHRAFQIYNEDTHLIDPFPIPKAWPRICTCDPASRRPFYFLWLAYDAQRETWIAYREFPYDRLHHQYRTSDWTIQDYATILRNLEGDERVDARVIDPRFGPAEYRIKGEKHTSVCDDFARYGLYFDPRVPDTSREETGIERVRQLLWFDTQQPLGDFNRPKLLVFKSVHSLAHALANYSFVPPDARDDRVLKDKTNEAFKDPIDALRYGILYGTPLRSDARTQNYISDEDWNEANSPDYSWL